jgi:serine/threonine-protein kinase
MSTQTCVKCGAALDAGARFCGGCGTQQPGAVVPQAAVRSNAKTLFQGSSGGPPKVAPAPAAAAGANLALDATIAPGTPVPAGTPVQPVKVVARPPTAERAAAPPPRPATTPMDQIPPQPLDTDLVGKTLNNRYLIEGKLGEGGFGAVYRAKQTGMGRTVALKVLHARMAKDPQVIGRFKREAQASSLLRAPHTVQVYDFDQTPEGILYMAMEMLQGRSLHAILQGDGPLDATRVARVMDGICISLGEAHAQGIVHRDIKPENVFLENQPTPDFVKVLDFGIAKIVSGDGLNSGGPALTAAGQTLGTLEYMSPEQLMGAQLDGRSDLYALGVLAYEMLTGQLPFPVKTPGEMITAHLKTVPPPPSRVAPQRNIPPAMDQIVLKLLEKQRDKRQADTNALRAELARLLSGNTGGMPVAAPVPVAASQPQPPVQAAPPTQPVNASRGGLPLGVIVLIAGIVVAVASGVAIVLWLTAK